MESRILQVTKDVETGVEKSFYKKFIAIKPGCNYEKDNFEVINIFISTLIGLMNRMHIVISNQLLNFQAKCYICKESLKGRRALGTILLSIYINLVFMKQYSKIMTLYSYLYNLGAHIRGEAHKNEFRNYCTSNVTNIMRIHIRPENIPLNLIC